MQGEWKVAWYCFPQAPMLQLATASNLFPAPFPQLSHGGTRLYYEVWKHGETKLWILSAATATECQLPMMLSEARIPP